MSYTKYVQENCRRSFWLALVFFALGLLAKPMLVTLPSVLLLLDFWPLKRVAGCSLLVAGGETAGIKPISMARLILEKWPFFLLTAGSCVVTFLAQRRGEAVVSLAKVSLGYRLENAPVAIVGYLQKLFLPIDLCAIYPMPYRIPAWEVVVSVAVLVLISVIAWRGRVSRPYFLMGWLWFLGTLVPVIGLLQVGSQAMADRYTYIPSIGFFIAVVFLLVEVAERIQTPKIIAAGLATIIGVTCILVTEYQLQFWRDSETLFRRAIAVTRDNDTAYLNLGATLEAEGRSDEAFVEYREALRLMPGWHQLHNNIANILDEKGRPADAAAEYRAAIELDPRVPYQHNSLGITLTELGQYEEAQREFAEAERLDPHYPWPHVETAKLFFAQGRDLDALTELRTAIQLEPGNYEILAYTAHVLAANKNTDARDGRTALALALKANALAGNKPLVFDALGMALAENGDYTNAEICAQHAFDLALAARMKDTNQIRLRLELYHGRQPWRESFRATNAPVKSP
jgi:tetratricopeptide (TPR) repeat protein